MSIAESKGWCGGAWRVVNLGGGVVLVVRQCVVFLGGGVGETVRAIRAIRGGGCFLATLYIDN